MAACLGQPISWSMAAMLCNAIVVFRHHHGGPKVHAPTITIHATCHVDHEKRVAWFLFL